LKRLGLLGGSFDPPHIGHLWIATFTREQLDLDQVLLVPAAAPPHKSGGTLAPYRFRLDLLRRLAEKRPWIAASDIEADATTPSYTIRTLRKVSAGLAEGTELWLLLGSDSLEDFPHWHKPDEIVAVAGLAVYGRPGHHAQAPAGARVRWIDGPACGLSSTLVRDRLRRGRSIDGMVPDEIVAQLLSADVYRREGEDG
jgi:nicotinate-nucleotide adenylyltransferase